MKSPLKNIPAKVVALVVGLLLWFHVATEKSYNYEIQLPVTDYALDSNLTLSRFPPDSIRVVVSATGKQLLRRKWREEGLRVNCTQFPAGRHPLTLTTANTSLVTTSNPVSLDEVVYPTALELHVDRKWEKSAAVSLDLEIMPDDGFTVASVSQPDPPEVTLAGPRSLLGGYNTVFTEMKRLTGVRNDLELALALVKPSGYGIDLSPDSVTLTVRVAPVKSRMFGGVPIVLFNAPADTLIRTIPDRVDVVVTGPPGEVDTLDISSLIASSDFAAVDSTGRAAVRVDCPARFQIKSISIDSVSVIRP